jgi:hypothetical protein
MTTRGKRSRKNASARKARRPVARKDTRARKAAAAVAARRRASQARPSAAAARAEAAARSDAPIVRRSISPISAGWSTLRVVWRPAISMATLPYRVYRVYRWAEAESSRSAVAAGAPR